MVTSKELKSDDRRRVAEKKKEREAYKRAEKKEARVQLRENMERARRLVDGELGDYIKDVNYFVKKIKGVKTIRIQFFKNWRKTADVDWMWREMYGHGFNLGFTPDAKYPPTKELVSRLQAAGFKAKAGSKTHQNVEYIDKADGNYDIEYTGGTHEVAHIEISW